MNVAYRMTKWLLRSWPILLLIPLAVVHLALLQCLPPHAAAINKLVSLFTQIAGGVLILYSIDSNIGIIKGNNLKDMFVQYLKECPLFSKSRVTNVKATTGIDPSGNAKISEVRSPETVEERLDYLQEQIDDVKRDVKEQAKEINDKIERETKGIKADIASTKASLAQVQAEFEDVSLGGIKVQLFGVLLMVYGAVASYVA